MKKEEKICILGGTISLIIGMYVFGMIIANTRTEELDSWLGNYNFEEDYVEENGPFMIMNYELEIYQENSKYWGKLEVIGQLTWITAKVAIKGDDEKIDVVFCENLVNDEGDILDYKLEGILFSLEKKNNIIYTYWENMSPAFSSENAPGEYFVRSSNL